MRDQDLDDNTIDRAKRFEKICDEFESQFSNGSFPNIESFLLRVEERNKQSLLHELIEIEMHYRRQRGEAIAFSDYQTRFPEISNSWFDETVRKDFRQSSKPSAENDESSDLGLERLLTYFQTSSRPGWLGRLSHYELERMLGQGAFGIVVKAFDERLHRVVAIKFMNPELAATSPPRKRFLREARTAAAIRHENIVGIYAIEEEPLPYIVMEYIPGITLQQWLEQNGPLELPEFLRIAQQLAAGLAAAHSANLIHRDIKPSNILLESGIDKHAKISDFGLARAVDDASLTSSGLIAGTPMYMAPEQARGEVLDHRADLFSLGSVLYQMASGRPPFRAANTVAMLKRVCEDKPRPIQDVIPETPDWLCAIIERLLEKRPSDRFQTAKEVADLLALSQDELKLNGKVASIGKREKNRNLETKSIRRDLVGANASNRNLNEGAIGLNRLSEYALRHRAWVFSGALMVVVAILSFVVFRYRATEPSAPGFSKPEVSIASGSSQKSENSLPIEKSHNWPADGPPPAIAPFSAEKATQHQEAWAKYLKVPVEFTNSIGMKFRLIPPGEFSMGMTAEEAEDLVRLNEIEGRWRQMTLSAAPKHLVRLTNPFYMSIHEVTQAQYEKLMNSNPSYYSKHGVGAEEVKSKNTDEYPVETVTPTMAENFCNKLSILEKRTNVYDSSRDVINRLANGYRLPTEAEWEWACSSGTTTIWSNGNRLNELPSVAWCGEGNGGPHPVGQLNSNPFGLFDMHGNVWEWCQDLFADDYYSRFSKSEDVAVDPIGPEKSDFIVFRGGSWFSIPPLTRSSMRYKDWPTGKGNQTGFRVALSIPKSDNGDLDVAKAKTEEASKEGLAEETAASNSGSGWHGWPNDAPVPAVSPFDADQARQHQEAWAKHVNMPVEFTNSIGMKFMLVPPGEFMMGSTPEEIEEALKWVAGDKQWHEPIRSEAPPHKVILTKPMYLGVTEVTQADYVKVMGTNPSYFAPNGLGKEAVAGIDTNLHPVELVTWNDAAEFCAKLSKLEKRKPFYNRSGDKVTELKGTGYRLPTEAEWEFACRGGTASKYWLGDNDDELANAEWFKKNSEMRTQTVGRLIANPFGLYDMHGNVVEWTQDRWQSTYHSKFKTAPANNPTGPSSPDTGRMTRGGCFAYNSSALRSAARFPFIPASYMMACGFRVALVIESPLKN